MRVNTAATFVRIYYHISRSAVMTLLPILLVHFFYLKKKKKKIRTYKSYKSSAVWGMQRALKNLKTWHLWRTVHAVVAMMISKVTFASIYLKDCNTSKYWCFSSLLKRLFVVPCESMPPIVVRQTSIKANRNLWCTTNSECVLTSPPAFQVAVAGRTSLVGKYIIFYCHTKQVEKLVAVLR